MCIRCKEACGVCCAFGTVNVVMSVVCNVCCVVWVAYDLFQECLLENECYLVLEIRVDSLNRTNQKERPGLFFPIPQEKD